MNYFFRLCVRPIEKPLSINKQQTCFGFFYRFGMDGWMDWNCILTPESRGRIRLLSWRIRDWRQAKFKNERVNKICHCTREKCVYCNADCHENNFYFIFVFVLQLHSALLWGLKFKLIFYISQRLIDTFEWDGKCNPFWNRDPWKILRNTTVHLLRNKSLVLYLLIYVLYHSMPIPLQ